MLKVLGIGDNVCDKYMDSGIMYPGGQALNFSVYSKMLGADASYMGVFGEDQVADHIIRTLDELGIEHSRCRRHPGENGYARVALQDGDRVFLGSNKGGIAGERPLELTEEDLSYIRTFQLLHTSNNSYLESQLKKMSSAGAPISYDFSYKWTDRELVRAVAPYADYVFLSCGSVPLKEVYDICRDLRDQGCGMITATRGSKGAVCFDGRDFYQQEPQLVEAVDTLGAGDSFTAAFLLSLTENILGATGRLCVDKWAKTPSACGKYQDFVRTALEAGAGFAARICMVRGAFGHGLSIGKADGQTARNQ